MRQEWHLRFRRIGRAFLRTTGSLWFFPLLLALGAVGLFILTSVLDARLAREEAPPGDLVRLFIFAGSPAAARSLLAAIATAWATILGVVFSISLLTVQLTTRQYTTQVLSQFERNRVNQAALGLFVGIVTYTFLVLKTVEAEGEGGRMFAPIVGTNVAIVLAILSLLLLIAFFANLVSFIRPDRLVDATTSTAVASVPAVLAPHRQDWLLPLPPRDEQRQAGRLHPRPVFRTP